MHLYAYNTAILRDAAVLLMRQVTGHSLALINKHFALAKKTIPLEEEFV